MFPAFVVIAIAIGTALGLIFWQQRQLIRTLRHTRDQLEGEETRAFDFLHRLGTELQENVSAPHLHRSIVEGITEVLEAEGAALYLLDDERSVLAPAFVSQDCPAVIELPPESSLAVSDTDQAILNYQRLQTIDPGHPLYGRALRRDKPLIIEDLSRQAEFPGDGTDRYEGVRILAASLAYAGSKLGLLIVARKAWDPPFSDHEAQVCQSLGQQSAFALGSARLHRDALGKRLLEAEIRTASEFQRILLPAVAPKLATFDVAAVNYPAKIVSGDYYDYLPVDQGHLGIAIADVSGKGVPASLIMATCRSVLRAKAIGDPSPSNVLKVVNRQIFPDIREDMFITMAYLVLNDTDDHVTIARAGHNAPLLFRQASGQVEAIDPIGMAVGIDDGGVFERILSDHQFELHPGDTLLLYTDGITEALDAQGNEFGEDALRDALAQHAHLDARRLVDRLVDDLRKFRGDAGQSDDITLIAIKKG